MMSGQGIVGPSPLPTAAALAGLETKIRRRDSTSVGGERKIPGRRGRYRNNLLSSYLSLFFSLSLYLSLFLSLSLSHTHTHSRSLILALSHAHQHTLSISLSLSLSISFIHPSINLYSLYIFVYTLPSAYLNGGWYVSCLDTCLIPSSAT